MESDFRRRDGQPFHPVMRLPGMLTVFDLTSEYNPEVIEAGWPGIGRYDEQRCDGMYVSDIYTNGRNVHMGIDLWAPAGTPVYAFAPGSILAMADNAGRRDYGPTIVTRHDLDPVAVFALHGHLSRASLGILQPGDTFEAGDIIGFLGTPAENGDWVPHLHFQLSLEAPEGADMPGVVTLEDRPVALLRYPDPRLVLGPLY
jgi:peptidoglycan LD-endopeptidase LytH